MSAKIPSGQQKGKLLSEAESKDIRYWLDRKNATLQAEPNHQFAAADRAWIAEADAVLAQRGPGGTGPAPVARPPSEKKSLERVPPADAQLIGAGASGDAAKLTEHLRSMAQSFHLVTPTTSVPSLPLGCGIAVSYVTADTNSDDVYSVGGKKVGISGHVLNRIAGAAGIDWDPRESGRLDDGSNPHYCHFRAVGYVRNFDLSVRTLTGEVEMDARDGSPQIDEIRKKAAAREAEPNYKGKQDGGASQILELRKFLLRHAESKAKNRAIAGLPGVKRSYHPQELDRPFAVARLMWTGQVAGNPELEQRFAIMGAEKMLDGMAAMYGRPMAALPTRQVQSPSRLREFEGHEPPPVGSGTSDDGEYDDVEQLAAEVSAAASASASAGGAAADQQELKV